MTPSKRHAIERRLRAGESIATIQQAEHACFTTIKNVRARMIRNGESVRIARRRTEEDAYLPTAEEIAAGIMELRPNLAIRTCPHCGASIPRQPGEGCCVWCQGSLTEGPPRRFAPVCVQTPLGFIGGPSGYVEVPEGIEWDGPVIVEHGEETEVE